MIQKLKEYSIIYIFKHENGIKIRSKRFMHAKKNEENCKIMPKVGKSAQI